MTPLALLFAMAVAAPTLHGALIVGTVPVDVALQRMLLIFIATSLAWSGLHSLLTSFVRTSRRGTDQRHAQVRADGAAGRGRRREDAA